MLVKLYHHSARIVNIILSRPVLSESLSETGRQVLFELLDDVLSMSNIVLGKL